MFIVFSEINPSSFMKRPSKSATAPTANVAVVPFNFVIVAEPEGPVTILFKLIVLTFFEILESM